MAPLSPSSSVTKEVAVIDHRWNHEDESVHSAASDFVLEAASPGEEKQLVRVRRIEAQDVPEAAKLCREVFNEFNNSIGQPPEFPPPEVVDVCGFYLQLGVDESNGFVGFVAVAEGSDRSKIVGSNVLEFQDGVGGIGPISSKGLGAGKLLMKAVMKEAARRNIRSVRLVQVSSNTRSFSLYLGLGFEPRFTVMQYEGFFSNKKEDDSSSTMPNSSLKCVPLTAEYVDECDALHEKVCHTSRKNRIAMAISLPHPTNVCIDEKDGKVVGYTTGSYLDGHTVALTEEVLQALVIAQSATIAKAQAEGAPLPPTTLFVPHQYSNMARWLATHGFRLARQLTCMSYGPHQEPTGGLYLPSIYY